MMRTLGFTVFIPVFFRHAVATLRDNSSPNRPLAQQDTQ
jgi:hypothetical protein